MPGDRHTRAEILAGIAALQAQLAQLHPPTQDPSLAGGPHLPRDAQPLSQGIWSDFVRAPWAWLSIPLFVGAIGVLVVLRIKGTWLPPMLLPLLSITFQASVLWLVSVLAARSYLSGQSSGVLYLGCGTLALGLGTALTTLLAAKVGAGWAVAVFHTSACVSGLCHLAGAIEGLTPGRRLWRSGWLMLAVGYLAVFALVSGVAVLAYAHLWPVFFVPGSGDTVFGFAVVWINVALFTLSAIVLGVLHAPDAPRFFRWYALGLGLTAVGLAGVSFQADIGDALNWAGRTAQYLGAMYLLVAATSSIRQSGDWVLPMEQALREVQERYRRLVDLSPDAILVHIANRYVFANPAAGRLFGARTPDELVGLDVLAYVHPDDREVVAQRIEEIHEGMTVPLRELRTLRLDGSPVHVEVSGTMVEFDGKPAILTVMRDISKRKRAEEALRESEQRLRHVLENARDITFGRNLLTGSYDYFSPAVEALTGYTVDEVISTGPEQTIALIHPDDRERYVASTRAIITSTEASPVDAIEYRWLTRSRGYRWFSMTRRLVRDSQGHAAALVGTIRDVHDGKLIEQERSTTFELLRLANNASSSAEMMRAVLSYLRSWLDFDALGIRLRQEDDYPYLETQGLPAHFVQAESHLCARTPQGELLRDSSGNPVLECMCGNVLCGRCDPAKPFFTVYGSFWTNSTTDLLASTTEADRQAHTRNRCNGEGYESVALIPLRASGETLGLLQLNDHHKGRFTPHLIAFLERTADEIVTIYAEKCARESLRELNATLEARVEARTAELEQRTEQLRQLAGELTRAEERERRRVAQVLHDDLQQVLVAARLSLHGLRTHLSDPAVAQAAQRADGLLAQSIDISRSLTAQLSPPVLHELGLAGGLSWLARWMEQNHHLSVELHTEPQAEPEADDARAVLFHCVRELLLNISKHAGVERAQVSLTRVPGPRIQVTVSDAGTGFDPAQVAKGRLLSGGMGLFTARERLGLIGGSMEIDSAPGRGTSVTLSVPLQHTPRHHGATPATESTPPGAIPASPATPSSTRVLRVLVTDDHTIVRQGIASLLDGQTDIEVVGQAEDGLQAIALARELRPDVILMDISMPRLGGVEATRRILAEMPTTRILALTMHEDPALEAAMRQAGAVGYLSKGGPAEALLAAIREAG